jgi:hypothetical protein
MINQIGPLGEVGLYGPNDNGYLTLGCREAARILVRCSELWSEGHYPHSNAKVMPSDHPIAVALTALAIHDQSICVCANEAHYAELFKPYCPSEEAQTRWNKYYGPSGEV